MFRMFKRTALWVDLIRLVLPFLILGAGYWGMIALGEAEKVTRSSGGRGGAGIVETAEVLTHDGQFDIVVDGGVIPFRRVDVPAEVDGLLVYKNPECRAGNYVTVGTHLFTIDQRQYRLEVERLERELERADAELAEVDVEIANNQASLVIAREQLEAEIAEVQRFEGLLASGAGAATQLEAQRRLERTARDVLQTLMNQSDLLEAKKTRLAAARRLIEIQLELAELDLERTEVYSTTEGTILEDNVELYSYARAGDVLIRITDSASVEVRCSLRVDQLYWLWTQDDVRARAYENPSRFYEAPQTPVTVSFSIGGSEYHWDGILSRYEGTGVDPRSRTVPCRVLVENPRGSRRVTTSLVSDPLPPPSLVSGMYVKVLVHTRTDVPLLAIPEQAMRPGNRVWLVRDGELAVEQVEVVRVVDRQVLVRRDATGLRAGDRVVISPLSAPYPGLPVTDRSNSTAEGDPSEVADASSRPLEPVIRVEEPGSE